jgi:tRNA(Ile)-lysidine synthase TilS/MesJ
MKVSKVLKAIREELNNPLPEPRVVSTPKRKGKMAKKAKKIEEDEDLDEGEEGEEDEAEDEDDEDEAPKSKKGKAKLKAKAKKKAAKSDDGTISVQELADEAGINAQSARVKLRDAEVGKPEGGRWVWKDGSKALKEARKALGL